MTYYNPNQNMLNQLMRQKDNVESLISQYSQPPVQNIINTSQTEFEAKILKDDEDVENIFISKKTMFLDKKNKKLIIKELDGKISEEYEIVIPLDEKDKKILDLETRLKEMEERINEYSKSYESINDEQKSSSNDNGYDDTSTATNG